MDDGDFVGDSEEELEEEHEPAVVRVATGETAITAAALVDAVAPVATALEEQPVKAQDRLLEDEKSSAGDAPVAAAVANGGSGDSVASDAAKEVSCGDIASVVPEKEPAERIRETRVAQDEASILASTREAVDAAPIEADPQPTESKEIETGPRANFNVGDIVHVAARTWPGINKLGGAGKIASVITQASGSGVEFLYNVKYMLGGFERRIEEEFVQNLSDALATGVRQHKERVFYHDEYANDPHKKQKQVNHEVVHGEPVEKQSDTAPETSSNSGQVPKKKSKVKKSLEVREKPVLVDAPDIEYRARSSDDSDYDETEDPVSEDEGHRRRIDDSSFIFGEHRDDSMGETKRSRGSQKRASKRSERDERRKSKHRHRKAHAADEERVHSKRKRSHRIIESDDEEEEEGVDRVEDHSVDHPSSKRKRRSKKRRYIGGYEHGSEDAEGSFIQPEGNPAELPDDVVKELKFRLGTSKAELRTQLESVADRLLENLGEFDDRKSEVVSRLELSASLDDVSLQDVNHKLLELGEFVRTKFIRSGEDVMNLIIKMLEKKGASLPDRIDLQFENWKQRVAEHDLWVKQSLRALENTFNRRGFSDAFRGDVQREETSSESDSSSESDNSDQDDFEVMQVDSPPRESAQSYSPLPNREPRRGSSANSSAFFESSPVRHASKKRPRSSVRMQSSLDGFAVPFDDFAREARFQEPRTLTASNYRFVRGRDDKILKDPRWDWARTLSKSRPRGAGTVHPRVASASIPSSRTSVVQKTKPLQKNESVMEAVLRLRDKRFRDRTVRPATLQQSGRAQPAYQGPPITHRSAPSSRQWPLFDAKHTGDIKAPRILPDVDPSISIPIEQEPREWSNIFAVLSAQENIPNLQTAAAIDFALLGKLPEEDETEETLQSLRTELCGARVNQQVSSIRQTLNTLRAMERDAMDCILKERSHPGSERPYMQSDEWCHVVVIGEQFHSELTGFMESLRHGLVGVHASQAIDILHSTVNELTHLLKQVPDCTTSFGDSPSYAYFFEVAAPGSKTSPLITAICRIYWYSIQVIILLKQICERDWPDARKEWGPIIEGTLSLNRVALAACLFLINLYIHIPSTHRFLSEDEPSNEGTKSEVPALALWLWLHEMFASGAIQSNKSGESSSVWHLLQTAYKQGIIDLVGISFMKRESFGGYVRERAPPKVLGSDEELQGKLLAADVLWDLSCLLGSLFHPIANSRPLVISTSWSLAKQLLTTNAAGLVPLNSLPQNDSFNEEFQLQAHGFKLRVLRRLLVLSAIWPPDSDILEKVFQHLWDSVQEEEGQAVLSSIIDFIGEVRLLEDRKNDVPRYTVAREHATMTTNSVELFCKIAVVQLSKLEKAIHRVRYRQPVLRVISAHIDKHKSTLSVVSNSTPAVVSVNASANTSGGVKTWNWSKKGGGSRSDEAVTKPVKALSSLHTDSPTIAPKQVVVEVNSILSIVMMFALSTVYLDEDASAQQQSARRKRDLKREIDFFCKELSSVSCDVPGTSVRLCECLSAVGTAALDVGVSFSTPFERLEGLLKRAMDELRQWRQAESNGKLSISPQSKVLAGVASSCLRALRDLSTQLFDQVEARSKDEPDEIENCINAVLGSGLGSAIDAVVDGVLSPTDLDLVIELLMVWAPKSDITPSSCLQFVPSVVREPRGEFDEFDEFDDPEMMDLLATVDLESGLPSTECSTRSLHDHARTVAQGNLRLAIQKILTSFPQKRWRSYQELYMIDLMGSMIATCKFPFNWSSVSLSSLKPRMFAPRLMGSILQHRGDSDWFSTCFLSEQNADSELSSLWVIATLDLRSLFPTVCTGPASSSPATTDNEKNGSQLQSKTAKYSSYWLLLTDGILAKLLKEDPVVRYKMDPLMYQLLHGTANQCTYGQMIRECSDPRDVGSLYNMHVDVFRAFCQSAGNIWHSLNADQDRNRQDMNRFRTKMMDPQRGVFVSLPETYEINTRAVCLDLDRKKINWYSLSGRFLDEFSAPNGTVSLHIVDDATSLLDREFADPGIRPLIILYKFMYDCVDSFLFNCGEMAIGQRNIFSSIIGLMFRQACCAEFPVAERRLRQANTSRYSSVLTAKSTSAHLAGVSPGCVAFTESVRLFFAYQKYPSLITWFAQNLETYQTLKGGWAASPLRVLLYNVFDPHGPLGIHSYYPMQDDTSKEFDPRVVRREAFYFACGLLHCQCSRSYEHTRCTPRLNQELQRSQLRRFVFIDFVKELREAALAEGENMDESLLPYFQLVKAFLNHLNLDDAANLVKSSLEAALCVQQDLLPCLVFVAQYAVRKMGTNGSVDDIISCVVLIEYVCIVEELVRTNSVLHDESLRQVIDVGLRCAGSVYCALGRFSSTPLEELFSAECLGGFNPDAVANVLAKLEGPSYSDVVKTEPGLADVKLESVPVQQRNQDDYGIGKVRVRSDLLASIRRLVRTCNDYAPRHPLLSRAEPDHTAESQPSTIAPPTPLVQVSVDGTM